MNRDEHHRFDLERFTAAATSLQPEHVDDFQRLVKNLRVGNQFQLLFAEFNDVAYRKTIVDAIDSVLLVADIKVAHLHLDRAELPTFAALEEALRHLSASHGAIHIFGEESSFDDTQWQEFNIRREVIAHDISARLIFWITEASLKKMISLAPDLWAWRGGVFSFERHAQAGIASVPLVRPMQAFDNRPLHEASKRVAVIRQHLNQQPALLDALRLPLLDEMAMIFFRMGNLDEALRIRREEELPVYEKLGDVRSVAVTNGKIADVLQARGELEEALRIYRDITLPAIRKLRIPNEIAYVERRIQSLEDAINKQPS